MYTTTTTTTTVAPEATVTSTPNVAFKNASSTERQKMLNFLTPEKVTNLYFTAEAGYARFDGLLTLIKTNTEIMFEVKNRNFDSSKYFTTFIEKSKFDFLMSSGMPAYVFVFFTDNKVLVHKLDKNRKYEVDTISAPLTTMGNSTKVDKLMVHIPVTDNALVSC